MYRLVLHTIPDGSVTHILHHIFSIMKNKCSWSWNDFISYVINNKIIIRKDISKSCNNMSTIDTYKNLLERTCFIKTIKLGQYKVIYKPHENITINSCMKKLIVIDL